MNSRHLVDPELLGMLDAIPPVDFSADLLPMARATPMNIEIDPSASAAAETHLHSVPGPSGEPDVGVAFYRPRLARGKLPCLFHIHGGGYVVGTTAQYRNVAQTLCVAAGCAIVSVEYRLAPETRFPGAIEDCYAALAWAVHRAGDLGIDPARIGVMGESAGGGLAAALALLVRDRGEHALAFQHLIYPMLDDRTGSRADPHPFAGEFLWTAGSNRFGWQSLLGAAYGTDDVSPYAAAARATDLSKLPPAYIATGALDLFFEEDLEYARRLTRHGVPLELHVYPGAYHGFDILTQSGVAMAARRDSLAALKRALGM